LSKSNKKAEAKAKAKEETEARDRLPHLERWGNGGGKKGKMNNE